MKTRKATCFVTTLLLLGLGAPVMAAETPAAAPAADAVVATVNGSKITEEMLQMMGMQMSRNPGAQPVSREDLQQGSLDWLHSGKAQQIVDDVLRILEHGLGNLSKTPGTEAF